MKKAQVVFIPSPGVGHLVSTLEFAKLLINRGNRLRITVLIMKFPTTTETDVYTKSLPISDSLNLINLPECSLPHDSHPASAMTALLEVQKPNIKQAVSNLTTGEEQHGHLAAFIVDMFCTTMTDVAKEFSVPTLVFFTSSAAFLGLSLHLHTIHERDNIDSHKLLQLTELAVPSFANSVPTKSLPSVVLLKKWESFLMGYWNGIKKADGIIVNSFEELESHAVHSFFSHPDFAGITLYPVGPIINLEQKIKGVDESNDIIKWLDDQPPSSVVFLCFGSRGSFDEVQIKEIALAVESTGARFIWSLRKPPSKGTMDASDYSLSDLGLILPKGFLDRTTEIGRVVGWVPQVQILAHLAIGGFVSHCGWNSILESIYFGVPIATWPIYAEQQTNAFELVCDLKMGVEIALDYNVEFHGEPNYLVTADKIEKGIKSVLNKEGEVRKKVKKMSEISRKTLLEGGRSWTYLKRLIDYIVNQTSN